MPEGLLLCVDLSSAHATVSLHTGSLHAGFAPAPVAESALPPGHNHSERFLAALDEVLRAAGAPLSRVERFVTPSGPGSFTGLRIALASLKAFAMALDRPLELVSGSEARALAWATETKADYSLVLAVAGVSSLDFARAELAREGGSLRFVKEETVPAAELFAGRDGKGLAVLLDDRAQVVAPEGALVERFPLRARHLAPALPRAATRRTFATLTEWIEAAPDYFGGGRFA